MEKIVSLFEIQLKSHNAIVPSRMLCVKCHTIPIGWFNSCPHLSVGSTDDGESVRVSMSRNPFFDFIFHEENQRTKYQEK